MNDVLTLTQTIEVIKINSNKSIISQKMPVSSEILQRLQANDPSITSLDLSFQLLTDADVIELCDALKNNDHLVSLNLRGNQITSSGAEALAQSQQIERLILDFNLIDNQGSDTPPLNERIHSSGGYL
jgi:hypothetical protein